jgi:hypothetical protein
VDIKAGVGGAGVTSIGEAGREMMLVRDILNAWASITINFWHT